MRSPLVVAAALLLALVPATASEGAHVEAYSVSVGGETATGLLGVPAGEPLGLVVIAHGYGHNASSHAGHLQHLADQGWLGVAMDYRGSGFPLANGSADTRAAIADLDAQYDFPKRVLYSVSMGTAVAALVLPHERFDLWVDNEGLAMLAEVWAEAKAVAPAIPFGATASSQIEAECGGTPAHAPDCYLARSAALRASEFDLGGVILTHGVNDGLVGYNQGREMVTALRAEGIPSDHYTVLGCAAGGEGTTLTGYTPLGGLGIAGHGTESNDAHCLTKLSFALLDEALAGATVPSNAEHVVHNDQPLL